ncbi:MAG: DUF5928 domain-containing protein [Pseudomonadota bacterium]
MTKLAFILLCHKSPERVIAQAELLTQHGDYVVVHYDARAPKADFADLKAALSDLPNVRFSRERIKCGWGEWSLVRATLAATETALEAFPDATHFYLLSGDCQPVKPSAFLHKTLGKNDCDFIETVDFFGSEWIRTGMKEDRLRYRHFFNERSQKSLFYGSLELQRKLGIAREVPQGLRVMIGSQWWCLRRKTIEALLAFIEQRRDVAKFFATTWIPDETFFQTLVHHLVPRREISGRAPTFLMFTDYGMPVTFYNDHFDLLKRQDAFFARKISPDAQPLRSSLAKLWSDGSTDLPVSDEGSSLHSFVTGRGRVGRRFAQRFWQNRKPVRKRDLLLISCKKWHVAERVLQIAREDCGLRGLDFVFHKENCALPDLGGIQTNLKKRNRHRRAVLSMLYEAYQTDSLVLCLDLSGLDMMTDFFGAGLDVRMLEIECVYSDAYLAGHAQRIGLVNPESGEETIGALMPTLRADIAFEHERISEADFGPVYRISETARQQDNATAIAAFLGVSSERAAEITNQNSLFQD